MVIDIEKEIHKEFEDQIKKAITDLGTEKLRPIKDVLPEDVSYFDIKYYIAKMKKGDKKEPTT